MGEGGSEPQRHAEHGKWGRGSPGSRSGLLCNRKRTGVGLAGHKETVKPVPWRRAVESCSLTSSAGIKMIWLNALAGWRARYFECRLEDCPLL